MKKKEGNLAIFSAYFFSGCFMCFISGCFKARKDTKIGEVYEFLDNIIF